MKLRAWLVDVAFFAAVALIPFLPLILSGHTIGPFDQIRQMQPWGAPAPTQPWDVLQADGALQFYGWRDLVLKAWGGSGSLRWNPYELCGYPLSANSQSAALYPPLMALGMLHVPTAIAIVVLGWLHLFIAAVGATFLARTLGASGWSARLAGIGFGLSPFLVAWSALSSAVYTSAWIPWVLVFALRVARGSTRLPDSVLLIVAVGALFTSGHLQFAAFGMMAVVVLVLVTALVEKRPRALLVPLALAAGVCLAAPHLLPVFKYSALSHRKNVPTVEGFSAYQAGALKPFELANLAHPFVLGNPREFSTLEKPKMSAYWPPLAKPGANYAESAITLGPLLLALLVFVPWRERRVWGIAAVGGLALLLAMGLGVSNILYFGVPGWSSTGSPGRSIVLVVLAASILAALGAERLATQSDKRTQQFAYAALGGFALLPIGLAQLSPLADEAKFLISQASTAALPTLLVSMGLAAVGIFALFQQDRRALQALPLLGLASIGCTGILTGYIQHGAPLEPAPKVEPHERIAVVNSRWDILTAQPALLPPNTATLSGIREVGGYDSLMAKETVDLLKDLDREDPAPAVNGNMMFVKPQADMSKLDEFGVSEVWSQERDASTGNWSLKRDRVQGAHGRAVATLGTVGFALDEPGHIILNSTGSGFVQVKERALPGWTAKIDGKPAKLLEGPWLRVEAGAGAHKLEFSYEAPGSDQAKGLFLLGLVALCAMPLAESILQKRWTNG